MKSCPRRRPHDGGDHGSPGREGRTEPVRERDGRRDMPAARLSRRPPEAGGGPRDGAPHGASRASRGRPALEGGVGTGRIEAMEESEMPTPEAAEPVVSAEPAPAPEPAAPSPAIPEKADAAPE